MKSRKCILVVSTLISLPALLHAQGFGVYEQGACAMGRASASVAEACDDGSAIYFNPAGLAGRPGLLFSFGGNAIASASTFTADSGATTHLDTDVQVPPQGYLQYGFNERLAVGVGAYAPYGLRVTWPLDFGGRFVSYDARLETIYLQPTLAYAVNEHFAIGAGITLATSEVELNRREDLATVPLPLAPGLTFGSLVDEGTDFASTRLSSSRSTGVGGNLGVMIAPHERFRIGLRYLMSMSLAYEGSATFRSVPETPVVTKTNPLGVPVGTPLSPFVDGVLAALPDQAVSTELEMPAQLEAGVSVHATAWMKIFVDYQWVGWSGFDQLILDFEGPLTPDETLVQNYRDTHGIRLGVEFIASPSVRLRTGYAYNQAAAPDETVTPILPEAERHHVTVGIGWDIYDWWSIDSAYQFIEHRDRRGRVVNPPPGELPTLALNSGVYSSRGNLLGLTMSFKF